MQISDVFFLLPYVINISKILNSLYIVSGSRGELTITDSEPCLKSKYEPVIPLTTTALATSKSEPLL